MNIAPYLMARGMSWKLPNNPICQRPKRIVYQNLRRLNFLFGEIEALNNFIDINTYEDFNEKLIGLYSVELDYFDSFVSGFQESEACNKKHPDFFRSILFDDKKYILFPDDASDALNVSLIAPRHLGNNCFSLQVVRYDLSVQRSSVSDPKIIELSSCIFSIEGKLPKRKFSCYKNGCNGCCKGKRQYRGEVQTYTCDCVHD